MKGDDRVRFCGHCSMHVYNLSAMGRSEAERLVSEREGRLCVQFIRRADGTVITADCEGGWRFAARRLGRWATTAAAVALSAGLAALGLARSGLAAPTQRCEEPATIDTADPGNQVKLGQIQFLGRIAPPAPQPAMVRGEVMIMGDLVMPDPCPVPPAEPPPATQPAPASTQAATSG